MTTQEAAKLIYVIKATYPAQFSRMSTADLENMVQAWSGVMENYTYSQASAGLKIYLASDTKGFPPSPGQVIDCIEKVTHPAATMLTEDEAWYLVARAAENSTYHAAAEFEKLPEEVRRIVVSPDRLHEMALMDVDEFQTVERSHFVRSYRAAKERSREEAKIPESIKQLISATTAQIEDRRKQIGNHSGGQNGPLLHLRETGENRGSSLPTRQQESGS